VSLLTELDAFSTEHRRCGELEAGVDGSVVWFDCACGARLTQASGRGLRGVSSRRTKRPGLSAGTATVLPMKIQVGDRFTDHDFESEVLTRPAALHGGKSMRARIRRPGLPETERDMTWSAHERVEIRRAR
jgi:hypothetical protein